MVIIAHLARIHHPQQNFCVTKECFVRMELCPPAPQGFFKMNWEHLSVNFVLKDFTAMPQIIQSFCSIAASALQDFIAPMELKVQVNIHVNWEHLMILRVKFQKNLVSHAKEDMLVILRELMPLK